MNISRSLAANTIQRVAKRTCASQHKKNLKKVKKILAYNGIAALNGISIYLNGPKPKHTAL